MKEKLFIGVSAALLVGGLLTAFQPPARDAETRRREQVQRQIDDLSEAQEREQERRELEARSHADAERERARTPGVHRTPAPRLRFAFRP